MKDTIGCAIVSGIIVGSFISGYAIAENRHLKCEVNAMASLMDLMNEITKLNEKEEEVPEEKTEE